MLNHVLHLIHCNISRCGTQAGSTYSSSSGSINCVRTPEETTAPKRFSGSCETLHARAVKRLCPMSWELMTLLRHTHPPSEQSVIHIQVCTIYCISDGISGGKDPACGHRIHFHACVITYWYVLIMCALDIAPDVIISQHVTLARPDASEQGIVSHICVHGSDAEPTVEQQPCAMAGNSR